MRNILIAAAVFAAMVLGLSARTKAPKPTFDGQTWNCPAGYDVYADEHEAIAGQNFVHCVK
jgi:hypothetical protein